MFKYLQHTCTCTNTHANTYTYIYIHEHTYMHMYTYAITLRHTHITKKNTNTHKHTDTHTHICLGRAHLNMFFSLIWKYGQQAILLQLYYIFYFRDDFLLMLKPYFRITLVSCCCFKLKKNNTIEK